MFVRAIDTLSDVTGKLSAWCLFAIGIFITYEIVARYVFNAPTIWVDEVSRILQIWVVYLAALYVFKSREMVTIDLVLQNPDTVRRRLAETFAVVVLFVFASVAAYYGFELWLKSTLAGHTTDTYLAPPKWFTHAPVWVGMVLLMLQGAVELTRIWSPAARGSANEHAAGSWKRSSSLSRWLLCCFCARRSPSRSAVSVSSCCG